MTTFSLFAFLAACGGDDTKDTAGTSDTSDWGDTSDTSDTTDTTDTTDTSDTGMPTMSSVRVLHLSPDAPAVDLYFDDMADPVVQDLMFGQGTGYAGVPSGQHRFRIAPANTSAASAVIDVAPTLAPDAKYTAVAIGRVASIAPLLLTDDSMGLDAGKVRVQVVHAAAAFGQVDIWEVSGPTPMMLLENVDFGAHAVLPDLPAGAYTVGIDATDDGVPDLVFSLPNLPGGLFVNLFAVSNAANEGYLVAQLPDGTVAQILPNGPGPAR